MSTNNTQHIYSAEYEHSSSGPTPASSVSYDNTSSGLDAVTAQAAIDEIEAQIDALAAEDVASTGIGDTTNVQGALDYIMSVKIDGAYHNTESGLSATTIQGAIDELAAQETTSKTPTFSINPTRYQCTKTSKLCMINAYWAAPTTGDLTITFPDDMKPDTSDYVEAIAWDSNSALVRGAITSAGVLTIPVDSSKNYSLTAIWKSI